MKPLERALDFTVLERFSEQDPFSVGNPAHDVVAYKEIECSGQCADDEELEEWQPG
ncbi:MAG: hypothetical protein ACXV3U_07280 [Halobacteriota archaeon]